MICRVIIAAEIIISKIKWRRQTLRDNLTDESVFGELEPVNDYNQVFSPLIESGIFCFYCYFRILFVVAKLSLTTLCDVYSYSSAQKAFKLGKQLYETCLGCQNINNVFEKKDTAQNMLHETFSRIIP